MKTVRGLFRMKDYRQLKIFRICIEAGISLLHQPRDTLPKELRAFSGTILPSWT
jgi:hypothetical protein